MIIQDLTTENLGGALAAFQTLRALGTSGVHPLGKRVPRADAKIQQRGGRLVFTELTATASREELKEKFMRWIEALDEYTSDRCAAVVFVNACRPDERANAEQLHREVFHQLLDHRPAAMRQFKVPWARSSLEETVEFRNAWVDWDLATASRRKVR